MKLNGEMVHLWRAATAAWLVLTLATTTAALFAAAGRAVTNIPLI